MFFLGFTGPLLTLVLSVLVPIFLFAARHQEKVDLNLDTSTVYVQSVNVVHTIKDNPEKKTSQETSFFALHLSDYIKLTKSINDDFPDLSQRSKKFVLELHYSGNKAPPVKYTLIFS